MDLHVITITCNVVFKIDTAGVWILDVDARVLWLLWQVVSTKFECDIFEGDKFCIRSSDLRTTARVLVKLGVFDAHHNPLKLRWDHYRGIKWNLPFFPVRSYQGRRYTHPNQIKYFQGQWGQHPPPWKWLAREQKASGSAAMASRQGNRF